MKEKNTKQESKFKDLFSSLWQNKRTRSILISAAVILICAVVYVVLLLTILKPEVKEELPTVGNHGEEMASGRPFVVDPVDVSKVRGIKVDNEFGGFNYYQGEDGNFYFEGAEVMYYDLTSDWMKDAEGKDLSNLLESVSMVDSLVNLVRYMLATEEVVGYSKDNLAPYGLENGGKAAVTLTYENDQGKNESKTVRFGNMTVSGAGYYVMVDGRDALYILQDTYITRCIFTDIKSYLLPQVAPNVSSTTYVDVKELTIKKKGEVFASIRDLSDEEYKQAGELFTHIFTSPEGYYPSTDNLQLLLEHFIDFTGESVLEFNILSRLQDPEQREEMQKMFRLYSLMDAENRWNYELYYRYDNFNITLYISEKLQVATEDEEEENYVYYIYSPDFDLIAEFKASELEWVEWDLLKLLDNHSFSVSIDQVSTIELSYENTNAKFTLQDSGDNLKVKSSNGVKVDTNNFRQLYKAILFTTMEGYADKPEEANQILEMKIRLRDGKDYNYKFYGMTARKAYYTLNDSGEFYINRDYVKQIISACDGILEGKTVTVDRKN